MLRPIFVSSGGDMNFWLCFTFLFCSLYSEAPGQLPSFFHQDFTVLKHPGIANPKTPVSQCEALVPGQTQPYDIN